MNAKKNLMGCLVLGLGLAAGSQAQTFTLPAAADTFLREGGANQNGGGDAVLQLSGNQRVLLRVDQATVASAVGSGRLVSASLELYVRSASGWGADGRSVEAHRLTADWTEAGATWSCGIDTQPTNGRPDCAAQWAGGTFEEDSSDTVLHTNDTNGWVRFDVTADVAAFLTGTSNRGWLLKREDEGGSGRADYASREGAAAERPRLVLLVETAANDQVPPSLAITSPVRPILVNEPSPTVTLEYADGGSGVDTATLQLLVDGQDATASCTAGPQSASCHPAALTAGNHTLQARLRDHAGNQAQTSFSFRLLLGTGPHLVTFQAVADTYVRKGEANRNFGAEPIVRVREGGQNRSLIQLDPQSLTTALADGTLVSASLDLHVEKNGGNWGKQGRTVDAHRLTAAWTELGATWNCPADSNTANSQADCAAPWNGGSFAAAPTASVLHTRDLAGWVSFDVTADVAAFATGTPNHGWLIKKTEEKKSGRVDYDSRQGTAGEGPRLVVVFQTAGGGTDTEPPTAAITSPAAGSFVAGATPAITATYSDTGSGIDTASVLLRLDGVNRTASAQVTASGLTFTPPFPLAEGDHLVEITLRDSAGNEAAASAGFKIDTVLPSLAFTSPASSVVTGDPTPAIALAYSDDTSGLDLSTLQITLDGTSLVASCTAGPSAVTCEPPSLAGGAHTVSAVLRDRTGHIASALLAFELVLDLDPPSIVLTAPVQGSLVKTPEILVTGTVADDGQVVSVRVNDIEATLSAGSFQATLTLQDGFNDIFVVAADATGKQNFVSLTVTLDRTPPQLSVENPAPQQLTNQEEVRVAGEAADESGIASLTVQQEPLSVTEGRFEAVALVAPGSNLITLRAVDRAGNETVANVEVTRFDLPEVAITFPEDLSFLATTTADVSGTVSNPGASVMVNGVVAVVSGTTFAASGVPLIEGGNILTATATDANGHVGTDSINVVRDLTAPRLAIHYPQDGATLFEPTITVSGMVNDIVAGTVNASEATVTVNGRLATVANRSFVVEGIPLSPGENVLTAEAADESGNLGEASITVHLAASSVPRITLVSGNHQEAVIGTALPAPLVVSLLDATGQPAAGKPVLFKLRGSNGGLDSGKRQVAVTTDAAGRASAHFTLGTRAGAGNQIVEATSPGFQGAAIFMVTARSGAPAFLVVDSGDQQVGIAGQVLPRPLVAVVTDAGHNRLEGAAVRLNVVKGQGRFANGLREVLELSDSDGRVIVPVTLDPEEGIANNVVEARIEGLDPSPVASFAASGRTAGDPAATSISGVVLDNSNLPIAGVTLRILGSPLTARTDEKGLFRISGAPVGTVKFVVDGSTVERPGSWPDLEFVLTTIPGRDNTVNMPIYLLPLNLASGLAVDETRGGTLTLPEIPGFALEILPGSVSFPGGSKSGVVSVTAVHSDKVPMVPNFGQQPRLIVTIQPAGARFEPPARLILPNVEGLAPGEVTEMYSFDHDLGHFVSIGPATVSDDGALIASNPGVGILKAGWHCGGNPASAGTPHDCPPCMICNGSTCVPGCALPQSLSAQASSQPGPAKAAASCACDACSFGSQCAGGCRPLQPGTATILADGKADNAVKGVDEAFVFTATVTIPSCSGFKYEWSFGDGATSTAASPSHAYTSKGTYPVTLKVRCGACPKVLAQDSTSVSAITIERLVVKSGATQNHLVGDNWATVKKAGKQVVVEAIIAPNVAGAADLLRWAGATPDPADKRLANVAADQSAKVPVKATLGSKTESVDIWVLWADLKLSSGGALSSTNAVSRPLGLAFPRLGALSDEANFADGLTDSETAGQVEVIGKLEPADVYQIFDDPSGWKFEQKVTAGGCAHGAIGSPLIDSPDDPEVAFTDTIPGQDNQVFFIDAPTVGLGFQINHTAERYRYFTVRLLWDGDEAAPVLKWYYFAAVDDDLDAANKPRNVDTVLNELGSGSRPFPNACAFQPRP